MTNPARLWALATPGILTNVNDHDHALLGGGVASPDAAKIRAETLRRDWEVSNRTELLGVLDWLVREGHRKAFNDVCALDLAASARVGPSGTIEQAVGDRELLAKIHFTRRHRERVGARSLIAWDAVRVVVVSGFGYIAGLLGEDEAWSYVLPAARAIQRTYTSWEELGQHHLLGREFWAGEWNSGHARSFLTMLHSSASPWRALPWGTDLSEHGSTLPLQPFLVEPPPPPGPVARMERNPLEPAADTSAPQSEDEPPELPDGPLFQEHPEPQVIAPTRGAGGSLRTFGLTVAALSVLVSIGVAIAFALGVFRPAAPPRTAVPVAAPPAAASALPAAASPRATTKPGPAPAAKKR
jgi:hypothetical protein